MTKTRLEAFSDGVIAIIITIMVLELRAPHGTDWRALGAILPSLLSYVLSFIYLGIYWVNHHHTFQAVTHISGPVLWANLHLLFWLSLVPFATGWMAEGGRELVPVLFYGIVLLMAGIAYLVLQRVIIASEGPDSLLAAAVGRDTKGKVSALAYALAIPAAFISPWIAGALFVGVAMMWIVPDRRIEREAGGGRRVD